LKGFFQHCKGEGSDAIFSVRIQFFAGGPCGCNGIAGTVKLASVEAAKEIHQDIVKTHCVFFIMGDTVEYFNDLEWLDFKTGLLAYFAADAVVKGLAEFKRASRNGPLALERLLSALDEEDFFFVKDDGPDTYDGGFRIFAAHIGRLQDTGAQFFDRVPAKKGRCFVFGPARQFLRIHVAFRMVSRITA
jgi:hypothetical protein